MKRQHLEYLCDPVTKANLKLVDEVCDGDEVISGLLKSATATYPVRNGIPRFVNTSNYSKSFGWQWHKWRRVQFEDQNVGQPMEGHTQDMFEKICKASDPQALRGQVVLDVGCGPGRFLDVALKKGARLVIGLDYSNAIDAARLNFDSNESVLLVQGDALNLPIRAGSIDGAYSIGVLHHTPDAKRGFENLAQAVGNNGWAAISVYAKMSYYQIPTVRVLRKVFNFLWKYFGPYPALVYSYFCVYFMDPIVSVIPGAHWVARIVFPYARLKDRKWSLLDTFDSLTPRFQSGHMTYEVYKWFKDNGFSGIRPCDWGTTSFYGEQRSPEDAGDLII